MSAWATGLNKAQRRAVEHAGGPLIVLAGPGTGKTRVITHRIARLLEEGAPPGSIAAVTFTVKAAGEMRARLGELAGAAAAEGVYAGTFHGFGARLLARFGDMIGLPAGMELMDSAQRRGLLESAVLACVDAGEMPLARVAQWGTSGAAERAWAWIQHLRSEGVLAGQTGELAESWRAWLEREAPGWDAAAIEAQRERLGQFGEAGAVYRRFERLCLDRGLLSFDEYLLLPLRILRESRLARTLVRDELRHIVVDEFQDLNGAQLALLAELAPPGGSPDLCVVGDDDQAIYGFRGADTWAFAKFADRWPDAARVVLTDNYRSSAAVLSAAGRIIAQAGGRFAPEKAVLARRDFGPEPGPVEAVHLDDDADAGAVIAALIHADLALHPEHGPERYAVIASSHGTLEEVGQGLELSGLPVCRSRTGGALDDGAVRDLLAWVGLLCEGAAHEAVRLLTRPPLRLGRAEAARLWGEYQRQRTRAEAMGEPPTAFMPWLEARQPPEPACQRLVDQWRTLSGQTVLMPASRVVLRILDVTGLAHAELLPARERAARLGHLVQVLRSVRLAEPRLQAPGDLGAYWAHYQRLDEAERAFRPVRALDRDEEQDPQAPGVRLLTAHGSKGLEFDTVFIPRIGAGPGQFGSVRGEDRPALPMAVTGWPEPDRRDEVRRLFYVAMTRAERRLVLLSRRAKSRSSSTHFFHELAWRGKSPLPGGEAQDGVLLREQADVLRWTTDVCGSAPMGIDPLRSEVGGGERPADALASARREAWTSASEALELLDDPAAGEATLEAAAARMRAAGERLAVVARLEAGLEMGLADGALPAWLAPQRAWVQDWVQHWIQRLGAGARQELAGGLTGPAGPLVLSYTQIDQYLRCPGCYYLRFVLGLGEARGPALVIGQVVHRALERFYRRWRDAETGEGARPGRADLLAWGREGFLAEAGRVAGLERGHLRQIEAQLAVAYDALHDERAEVLMVEEPFSIAYEPQGGGPGVAHTIKGKIDRVDRLVTGGLRIVDYKTGTAHPETGRASATLLEPEADDLQLGLYALGLASRLEMPVEELSGQACYWVLAQGVSGSLALSELDLPKIRARIDGAIEGILAGRFERSPRCVGECRGLLG